MVTARFFLAAVSSSHPHLLFISSRQPDDRVHFISSRESHLIWDNSNQWTPPHSLYSIAYSLHLVTWFLLRGRDFHLRRGVSSFNLCVIHFVNSNSSITPFESLFTFGHRALGSVQTNGPFGNWCQPATSHFARINVP